MTHVSGGEKARHFGGACGQTLDTLAAPTPLSCFPSNRLSALLGHNILKLASQAFQYVVLAMLALVELAGCKFKPTFSSIDYIAIACLCLYEMWYK